MIAAIYARKSTEQNGIADDQKSVARQVDDALSGATFDRPELTRLLATLQPCPPFNALVIADLDRIGREAWETGYILKRLLTANIRIFAYQSDQEIVADSPTAKLLLNVQNFAGEVEREKARQRTADAMLRKAKAGHVTGGRVYGYRNVDVYAEAPDADGRRKRPHVVREVNPTEAEVIQRIFALCAEGKGYKAIADILNREGVLAPVPRVTGRPRSWAASTIREILHRSLYKGEVVWNRTRKRDR